MVESWSNSPETRDINEMIEQFRRHKPPYSCPHCAKTILTLMTLKQHLLHIHTDLYAPPEPPQPAAVPEVKHEGHSGEEHDEPIPRRSELSSIKTESLNTPNGGKGKRNKVIWSKSKRKKKSRFSNKKTPSGGGRLNKRPPVSPLSPSQRAPNAGMSYEESLRCANFDIDGHSYRVSIDQPLPLSFIEDDASSDDNSVLSSPRKGGTDSRPSCAKKKGGGGGETMIGHISLPQVEYKPLDHYTPPQPHSVPDQYRTFVEKTDAELDAQVEYIMDDIDYSWLAIVNAELREKRGLPPVSHSDFELLMDRLEKECTFDGLKGRQSGGGGGCGSGGNDEDEAVCSICQDGEAVCTNVILFCDMCDLPVHQECYGVPYIPEGQWVCRKCLLSPQEPVACQLCPIKTGAFKQTTKGKWAHVACALWMPEVQFANAVFLEPIELIECVPSARFKLQCYICKKRNAGACIQCSRANCFTAFHISCGQSVGLHIKLEPVKDPENSPALVNVKKVAFCDVHTPSDSDRTPIINTDPDNCKMSHEQMKNNSKKVRQSLAQKQSGNVTVCLPEISVDRYEEMLTRVSFPAKVQFCQKLLSYWLLKRQARNGLPLIKRLHMTHIQKQQERKSQQLVGSRDPIQPADHTIGDRLAWLRRVRQGLEKSRLLCELTRKREKLKKELNSISEQEFLLACRPLTQILNAVMDELRALDKDLIFHYAVDLVQVPDYLVVVDEPIDLERMQAKVDGEQYLSADQLHRDFTTMINNCFRYNNRDTFYYKAAIKLRDQGGKVVRYAVRFAEKIGLDRSTGMLATEPPPPPSLYNCDTLESVLAVDCAQADKLQHRLHCLLHFSDMAAAGQCDFTEDHVTYLNQVINELQATLMDQMDSDVQQRLRTHVQRERLGAEEAIARGGDAPPDGGSPARKDSRKGNKSRQVSPHALSTSAGRRSRRSEADDEVDEKRSKLAKLTIAIPPSNDNADESSAPATRRSLRSNPSTPIAADVAAAPSTSASRGGKRWNATQEAPADSGVDAEVAASECSSTTDETEDCLYQHMDFVWAKCRGFPAYPGIVIEPETEEGTRYNNVPIPVPPPDAIRAKDHLPSEGGKLLLVAFFDSPITWQWLPESRLEPLFADAALDRAKLMEPRKPADKLKVRIAHKNATHHFQLYSGQRDPVDHLLI